MGVLSYNLILTLISFLTVSHLENNAFHGRIIYEQNYESYVDQIDAKDMAAYMGIKHYYYINDSHYMSVTNGYGAINMLYSNVKNNIDVYSTANDSLSTIDASIGIDEKRESHITGNTVLILGRKCKEIVFTGENTKMYYYYDPTLEVDYENFKNHKYSYWNEYLNITNSLPLKYILVHNEFSVTGEAVKIENIDLEDSFFTVENLKKLSKEILNE